MHIYKDLILDNQKDIADDFLQIMNASIERYTFEYAVNSNSAIPVGYSILKKTAIRFFRRFDDVYANGEERENWREKWDLERQPDFKAHREIYGKHYETFLPLTEKSYYFLQEWALAYLLDAAFLEHHVQHPEQLTHMKDEEMESLNFTVQFCKILLEEFNGGLFLPAI